MFYTISIIRLSVMFFLACLLCQCVQTADSQLPSAPKVSKQHTLSIAEHLTLANAETGNARQVLLITAATRAIHEGKWRQAQIILSQTTELTAIQMQEKQILLAKIDLLRERYRPALRRLTSIHGVEKLAAPFPIYFHEILAEAYQHLGLKIEAVNERIALEQVLPDEPSRQNNRRALWSSLMTFPVAELDTLTAETSNRSVIQGWAQLALIPKKNKNNATAMMQAIDQWQNQFPAHSANHLLPDPLTLIKQKMHPNPHNVALLLPITGALAGPGNAIKDGFMAASTQASSSIKVRVYDTQTESAASLYLKAIQEGADYVVGPLSKADVASVAAMDNPVPTLLLNEIETPVHNNAYQFGLSPTNEAIQVALKASNQGHSRALIIAPEGSWGKEIVAAFTNQWQNTGGQVVDTVLYKNDADLTHDVREALNIPASEARERQIKQLLGEKIQTRVARRNDMDMIFLLAYPSKARQIMPLLKYYYAGDIPVYATSTVYAGSANSMKDRDLNGIIFCDMPWVFAHQMGNKPWPEQFNSYNRLYALGMDSYALVTELNELMVFSALGSNDNRGLLYLNKSNHIARMLEWGQFKAGQAELLG